MARTEPPHRSTLGPGRPDSKCRSVLDWNHDRPGGLISRRSHPAWHPGTGTRRPVCNPFGSRVDSGMTRPSGTVRHTSRRVRSRAATGRNGPSPSHHIRPRAATVSERSVAPRAASDPELPPRELSPFGVSVNCNRSGFRMEPSIPVGRQ